MKKHYRHEHDCLNCGSELQGKFCHNCGQENLQIKESFGHMVNHAVSDYFHFDHQFFHTLKPLLLKPGKLTIEYMNGRRAQYLHPVKMYIFISLVYFVLIFKSNHEVIRVNNNANDAKAKKEAIAQVKNDLAKDGIKLGSTIDSVDKHTSGFTSKAFKTSKSQAPVEISKTPKKKSGKDPDSTYAAYMINQSKLPVDERDNFWEAMFNKTNLRYKDKYGDKGTDRFKEDVTHNIPKMMFVLLPMFALILKLAFWKNRKYYVEHLIYSIHLHCFFFLFQAIILLLTMLLPKSWEVVSEWLMFTLVVYTIYYIYRSLRVLYARSRWRTISKMMGISFMYMIVFVVCMVGLVMATAAAA